MPLYHIVGWLMPLVYSLPMLLCEKLGYDPEFTWTCFARPTKRYGLSHWNIPYIATMLSISLGYIFAVLIKAVSIKHKTIYTIIHRLVGIV